MNLYLRLLKVLLLLPFVRRRGLALSIAFSGVGIGSVTLLPWLQALIESGAISAEQPILPEQIAYRFCGVRPLPRADGGGMAGVLPLPDLDAITEQGVYVSGLVQPEPRPRAVSGQVGLHDHVVAANVPLHRLLHLARDLRLPAHQIGRAHV